MRKFREINGNFAKISGKSKILFSRNLAKIQNKFVKMSCFAKSLKCRFAATLVDIMESDSVCQRHSLFSLIFQSFFLQYNEANSKNVDTVFYDSNSFRPNIHGLKKWLGRGVQTIWIFLVNMQVETDFVVY